MHKELLKRIKQVLMLRHRHEIWKRVVSVLMAICVFCTTYALILPAITMTRNPVCGVEDHAHTEECYNTDSTSGTASEEAGAEADGDDSLEEGVALLSAEDSVEAQSEETEATAKIFNLGTSVLKGAQESDIYFGTYNGGALKWRVLAASGGNTTGGDTTSFADDGAATVSSGDAIFLMADSLIGTGSNDDFSFDTGSSLTNTYQGSDAQAWCNDFAGISGNNITDAFTTTELSSILFTTKSDAAYTANTWSTNFVNQGKSGLVTINFDAAENILDGDKVFLLSAKEANLADFGFTADVDNEEAETRRILKNTGNSDDEWWLRSAEVEDATKDLPRVGTVFWDGCIVDSRVSNTWAAAPAFNLNKTAVLFTTPADGSADNLVFGDTLEDASGTTEWKLTLADSNNFSTGASVTGSQTGTYSSESDTVTLNEGYTQEQLTISHAALSSFSGAGYTNITALLLDESGNTLYYGPVESDTSKTSTAITIPDGLAEGAYTLRLYAEDLNGENTTNYASGTPYVVDLTVGSEALVIKNCLENESGGSITDDTAEFLFDVSISSLDTYDDICGFRYVDASGATHDVVMEGQAYYAYGKVALKSGESIRIIALLRDLDGNGVFDEAGNDAITNDMREYTVTEYADYLPVQPSYSYSMKSVAQVSSFTDDTAYTDGADPDLFILACGTLTTDGNATLTFTNMRTGATPLDATVEIEKYLDGTLVENSSDYTFTLYKRGPWDDTAQAFTYEEVDSISTITDGLATIDVQFNPDTGTVYYLAETDYPTGMARPDTTVWEVNIAYVTEDGAGDPLETPEISVYYKQNPNMTLDTLTGESGEASAISGEAGISLQSSGPGGTVITGFEKASFSNATSTDKYLTIENEVSFGGDGTEEFDFEVSFSSYWGEQITNATVTVESITGAPVYYTYDESTKEYTENTLAQGDTITLTEAYDYSYYYTLGSYLRMKAGERVTLKLADGLTGDDISYNVEELGANLDEESNEYDSNWYVESLAVNGVPYIDSDLSEYGGNFATSANQTLTFENAIKSDTLTVSKTLERVDSDDTGADFNTDTTAFPIELKIYNDSGHTTPWTGDYTLTKTDANGDTVTDDETGNYTTDDGIISFTLAKDVSANISGLPIGAYYTIKEENKTFTSSTTGYTYNFKSVNLNNELQNGTDTDGDGNNDASSSRTVSAQVLNTTPEGNEYANTIAYTNTRTKFMAFDSLEDVTLTKEWDLADGQKHPTVVYANVYKVEYKEIVWAYTGTDGNQDITADSFVTQEYLENVEAIYPSSSSPYQEINYYDYLVNAFQNSDDWSNDYADELYSEKYDDDATKKLDQPNDGWSYQIDAANSSGNESCEVGDLETLGGSLSNGTFGTVGEDVARYVLDGGHPKIADYYAPVLITRYHYYVAEVYSDYAQEDYDVTYEDSEGLMPLYSGAQLYDGGKLYASIYEPSINDVWPDTDSYVYWGYENGINSFENLTDANKTKTQISLTEVDLAEIDEDGNVTITNSDPGTSISVTKEWEDSESVHENATVAVYRRTTRTVKVIKTDSSYEDDGSTESATFGKVSDVSEKDFMAWVSAYKANPGEYAPYEKTYYAGTVNEYETLVYPVQYIANAIYEACYPSEWSTVDDKLKGTMDEPKYSLTLTDDSLTQTLSRLLDDEKSWDVGSTKDSVADVGSYIDDQDFQYTAEITDTYTYYVAETSALPDNYTTTYTTPQVDGTSGQVTDVEVGIYYLSSGSGDEIAIETDEEADQTNKVIIGNKLTSAADPDIVNEANYSLIVADASSGNITITNGVPTYTLPYTGGFGPGPLYAAGLALLAAAVSMYIYKARTGRESKKT